MINVSNNKLLFWVAIRCILTVLLAILVPISANAQKTIPLAQAIKSALINRKIMQAGRADQTIRKLQTDALYRKYWPQISAEYNYLYNPILQTSILPIGVFNPTYPADATKSVQFGTKWTQTAGVTLYQPLLDASVVRQLKEAQLQERMAQAAQAQSEYELTYTVAQAYLDINLDELKVSGALTDTARTWASYKLLSDKFDQRRLLKSELNKGKINHNNAVQQYRNAVAQLIEDKVYLLFLMGENEIEHPDFIVYTNFLSDFEWEKYNVPAPLEKIPELQQLQLKSEFTGLQVKSERAKYLPTLGLKGYLGANQYANNFDPLAPNSWFGLSFVGIDLKCPLLFGEDRHRKVWQLQLQSTQYLQQKEDKIAQYRKDAILARLKADQILSEVKTMEENIALSEESIVISQQRLYQGQETSSSLNIEEAELQKLVADYRLTKRQYSLCLLDFLRATGRLDWLLNK